MTRHTDFGVLGLLIRTDRGGAFVEHFMKMQPGDSLDFTIRGGLRLQVDDKACKSAPRLL